MTRVVRAFLVLGCGVMLASSTLHAASKGVSPTSVQAEDRPDVGDVTAQGAAQDGARAAEPPQAPAVPMDDSSEAGRAAAVEDAARIWEDGARDVREQLRELAERKYKERRARIEASYKKQIDPVVVSERRKRLDAIAAFEQFLERHPLDPTYSPDAMFRLAELYYERSDDDYQSAMAEWKAALQAWKDAGAKGDAPIEPTKRFDATIAMYRRLIDHFPGYRFADGAYYLLGYMLRTQGDADAGMLAWQTLVDRFPDSRFVPEVWFRIGDQHFDDEKWEPAIAAFLRVVPRTDTPFYDKGLYKLAWTYYLVNRFDDAVTRFFELLDYSYANKKGDSEGSLLQDEAVQYVAISFGDDNWKRGPEYRALVRGSGPDDPDAEFDTDYVRFAQDWFSRAGTKPYERDVMARLGDNLFRQSRHVQAVQALQRALDLDPLHKDAPKLQDQIVQAWTRERQFDKANAARDLLVRNFGSGSEWSRKWAGDSEVRRAAEEFARLNLYNAALYYHKQANQYFADNRQDVAVRYFEAASDAYREYLDHYPHDKQAYEITYYLAETQYYSLHFEDAVKNYESVRDSTAGSAHRAEAGLSAVYAYDKIIEAATAAGTLPQRYITTGKRLESPEEIPALRRAYIAAVDKFLERGGEHEMAPAFAFRAGEIAYSYGQYDEAVRRFQEVVDRYPQSEPARVAANLILDDLLARKDWKRAAEVAARFQDTQVGGKDVDGFAKIRGGARFNIARDTLEQGEKLMNDGRITEGMALLESGAQQYLKLLEEDPKREFADVMVYNAALSLEKARRPARAAELYEKLYRDYPDSEWAPEAMFRVANKSEQAFNFDKAVSTYLGLVDKYPKSPRRADAQINAGLALEGQQRYEQAAAEFERYASLFADKPDAPDVFFRASVVHKKRGSPASETQSLRRFIARYQGNAALAPKLVEAYERIGDIAAEQSKKSASAMKDARAAWQDAIKLAQPVLANQTAAYFAARAAFQLAEDDFAAYQKQRITSKSTVAQGKELEAKSKRLTEVEATYKSIITTYKAAEWSLAALYRMGALYEDMQQAVLKSPCPDDIRRQFGDDGCDEYSNAIEDNAFAVEEKAVGAYKIAYDRARELRLSNQWTRKTLEALNLLRPNDYPIDKEPLALPPTTVDAPLGLELPDGGAPGLKAIGPGPAEKAFAGGGA